MSKKSNLFYLSNSDRPMLDRASGIYLWDTDGNRYIDYVMGCHPIILGYADPDVNKAVTDQLNDNVPTIYPFSNDFKSFLSARFCHNSRCISNHRKSNPASSKTERI